MKRIVAFNMSIIAFLCLFSILSIDQVIAASTISMDKVMASDGVYSFEQFGSSVSVSGDYAIVGKDKKYKNWDQPDSIHFYKRSGDKWNLQAKLIAFDGEKGDDFGASVAISGDYAIIGAPGDDDSDYDAGAVYIAQRSGSTWILTSKLLPNDGDRNDDFGSAVSISGDYAIVGAHFDDDTANASGSAYIFQRSGSAWIQQAKLTADDAVETDFFGLAVSISGEYAIIGKSYDNDLGEHAGAAYIFKRSGSSWTQQAKLTAEDGEEKDYFGSSVAVSGNYAIIGAKFDRSAYIFHRLGTSWTQQSKLKVKDLSGNSYFGHSVSISGNHAIVGAHQDDYYSKDQAGSAYLFQRSGDSWVQQEKLRSDDPEEDDHFGYSVSISGGHAVIGMPGEDHTVISAPTDDLLGDVSSAGAAFFVNFPVTTDAGPEPEPERSLFADFSQWGLFSYETPASTPQFINQSAVCMASFNGKLAAGFTGLGLFLYDGVTWQKIFDSVPRQITSWKDYLVADFTGSGLQMFDGTNWNYLTKSCLDMCTWNEKLVVSFSDWGLMTYDGSEWTSLTKAPVSMAPWGNKLAVNFADWGLFVFDGLGWTSLSKTVGCLATWNDKLAVSFDDWGLFIYDGSTWSFLNASAKFILAWNNDLLVGFNDWGLYLFDGGNWTQLSETCPINVETANFY